MLIIGTIILISIITYLIWVKIDNKKVDKFEKDMDLKYKDNKFIEKRVQKLKNYRSTLYVKKEFKKMNVNEFAKKVTLEEGKKISISIAQVKECLRIINQKLNGELYKLIRKS
jgi:hypothetical protein